MEILHGLTTGTSKRVAEIHLREAQYVPSYHSVGDATCARLVSDARQAGEGIERRPDV
jgi:hypothetical protein